MKDSNHTRGHLRLLSAGSASAAPDATARLGKAQSTTMAKTKNPQDQAPQDQDQQDLAALAQQGLQAAVKEGVLSKQEAKDAEMTEADIAAAALAEDANNTAHLRIVDLGESLEDELVEVEQGIDSLNNPRAIADVIALCERTGGKAFVIGCHAYARLRTLAGHDKDRFVDLLQQAFGKDAPSIGTAYKYVQVYDKIVSADMRGMDYSRISSARLIRIASDCDTVDQVQRAIGGTLRGQPLKGYEREEKIVNPETGQETVKPAQYGQWSESSWAEFLRGVSGKTRGAGPADAATQNGGHTHLTETATFTFKCKTSVTLDPTWGNPGVTVLFKTFARMAQANNAQMIKDRDVLTWIENLCGAERQRIAKEKATAQESKQAKQQKAS